MMPTGVGMRLVTVVMLLTWPLQALDDAARAWVLAHRTPGLERVMRVVSDRSRVVLVGGVVLGLVSGASGRAFVAEAVVALIPVNLAVEGLKWSLARPRPDGDTHRRNSSFPTSHGANAFTIAAVLARRWRRSAVPAWLAALTVAFSRMVLDRHWFSDVLGALFLALAGAWFAASVVKKWQGRKVAMRTS